MLAEIKKTYLSLPTIIKQFLVKGLIVLVVWQVAYIFFLEPNRVLDRPLTNFVADNTVTLLDVFYDDVTKVPFSRGEEVMINGEHAIGVADGCNGLALFVVYIGFILCFPIQPKRLFLYIVFGVLIIHALNILRVAGLAYVNLNYKEYMEFAHHYLFKIIVYSGIFYLWVLYAKRYLQPLKHKATHVDQ